MLETKSEEGLKESFRALTGVHLKLKQITEDIKVSETELLDVASLINY